MHFWQAFLSTFSLIFLAELGDKTQLAVLLLAAQGRPLWGVFLGSASALVLSALLGVLLGGTLSRYLPPFYLQKGAGVAFVIIGLLLLWGKS
ncbi:MAG: TMEM165/GDT1 family protein [Dethiobacteria bacterium]|jgi:putative Ca2+/H+ antiporter (TMEM165/GDT1 family)